MQGVYGAGEISLDAIAGETILLRMMEDSMRTAFLGPRGTFSEDAAIAFAGAESDLLAFNSIPALTAAVETGLADQALLPIENSIEGSISTTLDLLIHETPLKIAHEVVVPVRHFLITAPGATLSDITVVTSHPQPFGQCRRFLERVLPKAEQVAALSTAAAVEEVAKSGDVHRAAIGTKRAAELYGGHILAHDIQDMRSNFTRFVVLRQEDSPPTGNDKTSIGFVLHVNAPGSLLESLTPFAEGKIELTRVESRPTKEWLGEYYFLLDFQGHRTDELVADALDRLRQVANVKVFGSYPRFDFEALANEVLGEAGPGDRVL
jgi:prephenate dehydratase